MSENRFNIGDHAVIECESNPGLHTLCDWDQPEPGWVAYDLHGVEPNCWHRVCSSLGESAQWVAVVNPADREQMKRLYNGFLNAPGVGVPRTIKVVESLRTQPPLPPEPPVGSMVMDRDGNLWTREPDGWCGHESWHRMITEYGPVRLVTLSEPIGGDGDE